MNSNVIRRIIATTAPAVLLAGVITGCSDAGSTAAPSGAAGRATVKSAGKTSAQDPSQTCAADTDGTLIVPGIVGAGTTKSNWGSAATVSQDGDRTRSVAAISVGKPVAKKQPAAEHTRLRNGQVYLLLNVSVKYKSGEKSDINSMYFVLRDDKNHACAPGNYNTLVPKKAMLRTVSVSTSHRSSTRTLVYQVPAGQDYSTYTLSYGPAGKKSHGTHDPASAAWTA